MKKINLLPIVALCALATSCVPAVTTTVLKTYPAYPPDSVVVYNKKEQVPENAEGLGQVVVRDGGFTTQCDSLTVVGYVKLETGKMGGNAALITEHIKPSFMGSTCHQMRAIALRTDDFKFAKALDSASAAQFQVVVPGRKLPHARFAASVGYGRRLAKLDPNLSSNQRSYYEKLKSGFIWEGTLSYFFNDWYGIGLDYSGYFSSTSGVDPSGQTLLNIKTNDLMTYVGLNWAMRYSAGQKWLLDGSLGLGYFGYTSTASVYGISGSSHGSTVGFKWNLGIEYKIDESWGIGGNIVLQSGILKEIVTTDPNGSKTTYKFEDNEGEGLGQLRLQVGVRYYIK